ncbi:MAG: sugar phosphate isomerase/epimerase [Oscillospiraceae bacterium]|jgi:hexulose-6-phosphate isomerase|nr:sugar phosphate isomerase/epimerase [Oscillospiraceae bacterium]
MLKAINAWSLPDNLSPLDQLRAAKKAGFEAYEPVLNLTGPLSLESGEDEFIAFRKAADAEGVALTSFATGLYWQYPFTSADPAIYARSLDIARFQLRAAKWLGARVILVVPGNNVPAKDGSIEPYDVLYNRALDAVRSLAPLAEELGVTIGIENVWNNFLITPLEMTNFVDAAGSKRVGAYFDVGNVILFGYPQQWIDMLGNRIVCVHIKDFKKSTGSFDGFGDLLTGDVDFPAVMASLKKIGYDHALIVEKGVYARYELASVYNASTAMDWIMGRQTA